ncbi:MAG TPA: hypothetical protein PLB02_02445, partial [Thermoanaerobaculia bacterium]|nr:hypothetical protein [Thermoanaerobaculia bacterium]
RKAEATSSPGFIAKKGWLVQYLFGKDERGEYLDFYSSHRMCGDDHRRIRTDGSIENLEFMTTMYGWDPDDPDGRKKAEEENCRENRRIAEMLLAKGFDRFNLNMALAADLIEEHLPLPEDFGKR